MTIFEKKSHGELPIIDGKLSLSRAIYLIMLPILITGLMLFFEYGVDFKEPVLHFITVTLLPLSLFILTIKWLLGSNLKDLFQGDFWANWKPWLLYFFGAVFYAIFMGQVVFSLLHLNVTADANSSQDTSFLPYLIQTINDLFSLFNEELFAIPVFIGFAVIFYQHLNMKRNTSIYLALFLSMIIFGLAHFEAYSWNLPQMLLIMGALRFFVTGSFIRTRNILIPYTIHFAFDTLFFTIAFLTN
ncbi:CPBP family glutamic-type intramembrane protease [Furfurilactobacillus sp. WILCCON 0119]